MRGPCAGRRMLMPETPLADPQGTYASAPLPRRFVYRSFSTYANWQGRWLGSLTVRPSSVRSHFSVSVEPSISTEVISPFHNFDPLCAAT